MTYPFDELPIDEGIKRHREQCGAGPCIRQDGGYLRFTCCGIPEGIANPDAGAFSLAAAQRYIEWRTKGSPVGALTLSDTPVKYRSRFDGFFNLRIASNGDDE